jgi:RNA polymerase sigma factor (sigma-70 family)
MKSYTNSPVMTYNEETALQLLGAGSERGFKLIYERYAISVTRIAYKFLKSPDRADDLVQEVFVKMWTERDKFVKADNFKAYLLRTATNLAYDHLKKIAREEIAKKEFTNRSEIAANNIDHYIIDKEYAELLQQAIEGLPPQCRRVYQLVRGGLSHKEVADQLRLSRLSVES